MNQKAKASSFGTIGFMIAAIVFAAVAGILLSQVMESTYSQEPVKPIVVAARKIPTSTKLKKKDLKLANWPESSVPVGAYKKIEEVLKSQRVPMIPFVKNEPVLKSHLSKPRAGMGVAPLIDMDKRAVAIRTDNAVTLTRMLYPGAIVDVLTTMRNQGGSVDDEGPRISTKIVLQDIKVLSVGEDIDPLTINARRRSKKKEEGALGGGESSDQREARSTVTLLVAPEEAERLVLALREGKIDLVLRNPKDHRQVETTGATEDVFMPQQEEEDLDFLSPEKGGAKGGKVTRQVKGKRRRGRRGRVVTNPKAKSGGKSGGIKILR